MATREFAAIATSVDKTNRVLKDIEDTYGWPKEERHLSFCALRSVLHALRDRLTVEKAADVASQLPMVMRGLFYEGWKPARVPMKLHREAFLERVSDECPTAAEAGAELLVRRVLHALERHITEGEWADIRTSLPRDLASLLPS